MNDLNQEREAFERAVTAPPFELSIERLPATAAWPGAYRNDATQIAWDFWQQRAALAANAAPQISDAIFLICARLGLAGASDEEVLRYVRTALTTQGESHAD